MAKKVLFIGGSQNQTTMVHRIAEALPECERWFTPYYADGALQWLANRGVLDFTVLGRQSRRQSEAYFEKNGLLADFGGRRNNYDLVVTTNDVILPRNIRSKNIILVQEGMITPENLVYHLVRQLRLPRYLGNTAMAGLSFKYRKFCVASEGFREIYLRKGVPADKIEVTGIPNFDDLEKYRKNDFPFLRYTLGATSCLRETGQFENRKAFIFKSLDVAGGRQLIFKLHPREDHERARREIERYAPDAIIFESGNTNHMIANCDALVTKYSSVLLTALGLGKPVYSDLAPDFQQKLTPLQNGGTSSERIAGICREYI
jgi:hypothetical protein